MTSIFRISQIRPIQANGGLRSGTFTPVSSIPITVGNVALDVQRRSRIPIENRPFCYLPGRRPNRRASSLVAKRLPLSGLLLAHSYEARIRVTKSFF